jgi:hypothetical protein
MTEARSDRPRFPCRKLEMAWQKEIQSQKQALTLFLSGSALAVRRPRPAQRPAPPVRRPILGKAEREVVPSYFFSYRQFPGAASQTLPVETHQRIASRYGWLWPFFGDPDRDPIALYVRIACQYYTLSLSLSLS